MTDYLTKNAFLVFFLAFKAHIAQTSILLQTFVHLLLKWKPWKPWLINITSLTWCSEWPFKCLDISIELLSYVLCLFNCTLHKLKSDLHILHLHPKNSPIYCLYLSEILKKCQNVQECGIIFRKADLPTLPEVTLS